MDKSELESRKLLELKELANTLGIEGAEKMKKAELIDKITEGDSGESKPKPKRKRKKVMTEETAEKPAEENTQPSLFEENKKEDKVTEG